MIALVIGLFFAVVVLVPIAVPVYMSLVVADVDPPLALMIVLTGFVAGTLIAIELASRIVAKGQRIFNKTTC